MALSSPQPFDPPIPRALHIGKRVLVLDLDGTILGTDFALAELTERVVRAVHAGGTQVVIATGRTFRSARPIAQALGIAGPIITHQGAQVREVRTGRTLFSTTIPLASAREVLAELDQEGLTTTVYLDDVIFVAHMTPQLEGFRTRAGVDMRVIGPLATGLEAPPTKIVVNAEAARLDEVQLRLRSRFDGRLNVAKSWPIFLEIAAPGVSKAAALRFLAERDDFAAADVIAFGDSAIDLDMIVWAGTGVAVADAPDEVRRAADDTCGVVADQGVAHYLLALAGLDRPTKGHA